MIDEAFEQIIKFRDDRDWKQFHNPKDLAISINLEAAELLENFQWTGHETEVPGKNDRIIEELADVFIYCVLMADAMNVEIGQIIKEKLKKSGMKYEVEKARGSKKKYTELG